MFSAITSLRVPGLNETHSADGRETFVFLDGCPGGAYPFVNELIRVPIEYIPNDGDLICVILENLETLHQRITSAPRTPDAAIVSPTPR